ncbi:hypothetical protein [Anaerovibrio sp.]|uniref:hypothetical protein n=1 Tax=Anaerovibrio sp. TaxID=1872532 RepID=UPI00261358E6|nr:hypothetical protein [Anaerovibrio sp.]MDD6597764.1 hypothetical protein [Anaerovibrio sp.]
MSEEKDLDLQAILKRAEQESVFPDVPLDEFAPPGYDEWKEACIALLKGAPFEKKMYTDTYEGITFSLMYFRRDTEEILPKIPSPAWMIFCVVLRQTAISRRLGGLPRHVT